MSFLFPLLLVVIVALMLCIEEEPRAWLRIILVLSLILNSISLTIRIPIATGYPTDREIITQIKECEKNLPRDQHCKIEIVKP